MRMHYNRSRLRNGHIITLEANTEKGKEKADLTQESLRANIL